MNHTNTITNSLVKIPREYWRNDEFAWVSIPKNANTQFRTICKNLKAGRRNNPGDYPPLVVCVWRNPRDRLVSGMGEYLKRRKGVKQLTLDIYDQYFHELLENSHTFDEHLEPQSVYASDEIPFTHVLRFENLWEEMSTFPPFAAAPQAWQKAIDVNKLKNSKHTGACGGIDNVKKQHSNVIDNLMNKYYSRDMEIFENTTLLVTKND